MSEVPDYLDPRWRERWDAGVDAMGYLLEDPERGNRIFRSAPTERTLARYANDPGRVAVTGYASGVHSHGEHGRVVPPRLPDDSTWIDIAVRLYEG